MLVSKKKYNKLADEKYNLENQLALEEAKSRKNNHYYKESLKVQDKVQKDLLLGHNELENKIASLETELSVKKLKNEQLEDDIKYTKEAYNKLLKTNNEICTNYNRINNKLWCQKESIRQLDRFADVILGGDMKIKDIASYARQIAFFAKGYENKVYVKEECEIEGCENE